MTKIKKYTIYLISLFSSIILMAGGLFTALRVQSQRENNYFYEKIEEINYLIKTQNFINAKKEIDEVNNNLKTRLWNKKEVNNKRALLALLCRKTGDDNQLHIVSNYISKAENYNEFNLVKECLLRLIFLEQKSYEEMQKFRWNHNMQRLHLLSTLRADLKYKSFLPKQLFDFYLHNLRFFSPQLELETLFMIMAAL